MDGPYERTDMAEHLALSHGVPEAKLQELWGGFSGGPGRTWEEFLEVNHDLLHSLARGEVVRGA